MGFKRLNHRDELPGDMGVRIVENGSIDEVSPEKAFLGVRMKTRADSCATQKRIHAAYSRKELAVEDRIDSDFTQSDKNLEAVFQKPPKGTITHSENT
jgi:hypothetical protein